MIQTSKSAIVRELKAKGYKRVSIYPSLYLNQSGELYDTKQGKAIKKRSKNLVFVENRYLSIPKLLLFVFKNEPIRENQRIKYLNGNSENLSTNNVQYVRKFKSGLKNSVNPENLRTAIRCYFAVAPKYKVKDCFLTKIYLSEIAKKRLFEIYHSNSQGFKIFQSYINKLSDSTKEIAKREGENLKDVQYLVNHFTNLLISDILADLQGGKLAVLEYHTPKTEREKAKQINEHLKKQGLPPLPLRKKSEKESIKSFRKLCKDLKEATNG